MAIPHSTKVVQVSKVAPFTADSAAVTDFSLPLTFFDTFWFKFPPVERLFFYSLPQTNTSFFNSILPKLKHSLSLTLQHFLPLAGKLTWPSESSLPIILFTAGDAISLTVVDSDANFHHLSGSHVRKSCDFSPLVPSLVVSETGASLMAVQITLFNGGFCIGITAHHAVLDGKSSTMFMKAWAHISKQNQSSLPPELTPCYDRTMIKDPEAIASMYANQWLAMTGCKSNQDPKVFEFLSISGEPPADMVRASFEMTRSDIEKLKKRVLNHPNRASEELHLSSFAIAYSYVFVCIVKAKIHEQIDKEVYYGFVADKRSRLNPPVPENYFGNCVAAHYNFVEGRECIEEDGFYKIVARVSELIKEIKEIDVYEGLEDKLSLFSKLEPGTLGVGVAGSPRFGVYSADFGWGKPEKVEITSVDKTGSISMAEMRDESGGIEVGVPLKKHEMELFTSIFSSGLEKP
ncbi:hypothetical protein UlMin_014593 [Ulmus minor]